MWDCGLGGRNRERNRDRTRDEPLFGEANSYLSENTSKFCVFGYPLSESVAPPGTAWDAEGLRGNEANENNTMLLAPAVARKWQSASPFAQEAMAVREAVFQWSAVSGQRSVVSASVVTEFGVTLVY